MPALPFHTLDVFTHTPFAGNPLAVVLEADGLSDGQMQRVAREFNLSETVFVQRARQGGAAKLRIFTPTLELPFAGHPTIGTALLLAELGRIPSDNAVLEENVGLVPLRFERRAATGLFAELSSAIAPELRSPDFDLSHLPAVLGLAADQIGGVQMASCGNPVTIVRLTQPEQLNAIDFQASLCRKLLAKSWTHGLYCVAPGYEGEWQARFFAPDLGVGEDPATGSAAVAFAGALAMTDARSSASEAVHITQGVAMGRPSQLFAHWEKQQGRVSRVSVGGHAVRISSGTLRVD